MVATNNTTYTYNPETLTHKITNKPSHTHSLLPAPFSLLLTPYSLLPAPCSMQLKLIGLINKE